MCSSQARRRSKNSKKNAHNGDVVLVNQGVGSAPGVLKLLENEQSDVSSFLQPTGKMWGRVVGHSEVEITTVDSYAQRCGIDRIDLLKSTLRGSILRS